MTPSFSVLSPCVCAIPNLSVIGADKEFEGSFVSLAVTEMDSSCFLGWELISLLKMRV